ncbi:MAG: efflux RND transporter permease subunit, partial [Myxococcales bacterium]|nr:efflux RND transporter permease subunit [Myxococcales bacterium]
MAPEMADRLGLSAPDLAQQLRARNVTVPGGSVVVDGRSLVLRHLGELDDVAQIRALPVVLPSGATVPLSSVADVNEATEVPRTARILHDGAPAVGVSVVPVPEQDLVGLGERLEAAIAESSAALAPLRVEVFAFQPTLVRDRIGGLTTSLLLGVLVVAGVLFVAMGPRMGVVVS